MCLYTWGRTPHPATRNGNMWSIFLSLCTYHVCLCMWYGEGSETCSGCIPQRETCHMSSVVQYRCSLIVILYSFRTKASRYSQYGCLVMLQGLLCLAACIYCNPFILRNVMTSASKYGYCQPPAQELVSIAFAIYIHLLCAIWRDVICNSPTRSAGMGTCHPGLILSPRSSPQFSDL